MTTTSDKVQTTPSSQDYTTATNDSIESIHLYYRRFGEEEVDLIPMLDSDTIDYIKRSLSTFNPDINAIIREAFERHLKKFPKV